MFTTALHHIPLTLCLAAQNLFSLVLFHIKISLCDRFGLQAACRLLLLQLDYMLDAVWYRLAEISKTFTETFLQNFID